MSVTQSPLKMIHNGDMIVNFKSKKEVQSINGYQDMTAMSVWYEQDSDKYNLGMIKLWGQQAITSYPMYAALMEKKAMIEVNGDDGTFTYEYAVKDSGKCATIKDYSAKYPNAGLDSSIFRIALNKRYATGVILTTDMQFGEQIIVVDEEETRQIPGGWDMAVKLTSNDRSASYDPSLLVSGLQYFKVSHAINGEYGTNYENVDLVDTPTTVECMFQLGSASGAEAYVTGKADRKSFSGASSTTKEYLDTLSQEVNDRGDFAVMTEFSNLGAKGEPKSLRNLRIGATMQLLVHREHQKSVSTGLLFQKAGTVSGTNGITRLTEGFWHQMRRGKLIQYGRPMGITRAHVKELVEYVFRGNPLPSIEREVELACGQYAIENMRDIFSKEIDAQLNQIGRFVGAESLGGIAQKVVTGSSLTELKLAPLRFTEVFIEGIGNLKIKEDVSLNHYPGADRFSKGFHSNGLAHTAYSIVVWDCSDQQYSNNKKLPQGAKMVEGGDTSSNMFIVKPENGMTYWGSENGRYHDSMSSAIVSSNKFQMQSYWIYSICGAWLKDASKYAIIELDPKVRNGFN
jgi:hypothetical protein